MGADEPRSEQVEGKPAQEALEEEDEGDKEEICEQCDATSSNPPESAHAEPTASNKVSPQKGEETPRTHAINTMLSWATSTLLEHLDAEERHWSAELVRRMTGAAPNGGESQDEREPCPVCFSDEPSFSPECGHGLCVRCSVQYVRGALGDAATQVLAGGVRCPLHSNGCEAYITSTDAAKLLSSRDSKKMAELALRGDPVLSRSGSRDSGPPDWVRAFVSPQLIAWGERHVLSPLHAAWMAKFGQPGPLPETNLTLDEVRLLHRFAIERAVSADERAWCPQCGLLVLLPDPCAKPAARRSRRQAIVAGLRSIYRSCRGDVAGKDVQCPHCRHRWDLRAGQGDVGYDDRASAAYIRATSKACPNKSCGCRISHFHGHACHHISPKTNGCPTCHQHFCYVCGRKHGRPGQYRRHPLCSHGSSFCNNSDIHANLVSTPYPHDRRCGCPICPLCRRGRPCEQCDGRCVVCTGAVPPGPEALSAADVRIVMRSRSSALRCVVM